MESSSAEMPTDRVQFETLLSDISAHLIAVGSDRFGEAIESALDAVRRFFRADRCVLLAVSDDLVGVHVAYAASADGVPPLPGDVNLALSFPWLRQRLVVEREPVAVLRWADVPAEAAVDRASAEASGTQSCLLIPIEAGPKRLHLININTAREERTWPEEYMPRLRLLGEVLVNALERGRATDRVREQAARLTAAVDAAELGFSEWMPGRERPYLDTRSRDLLGIGEEELAKAEELWVARMHAESRPAAVESRRRLLAGEGEFYGW